MLIGAYQEFERRIGTITKARDAKTAIIEKTINLSLNPFQRKQVLSELIELKKEGYVLGSMMIIHA